MTDNLSIENKLKEYFAKQYQITDSEDENPFYIIRPEELNGGNNIEGIVENIMTGGRAGEKCLKMTKRKIKGLTGGKIRKDSSKSSTDDSSDNSTKDSTDDSTKKAIKKMADKDDDDFDFQIFDSSGNEILDGNDSDTSSDSDDDRYKNKSSSSSSDYVSDDDSLDDDALDDDEDIKNYIKKIMTGGKVETVKIIQKFPYVIEKEWRCVKIWLWKKCSSDLRKHGRERNVRQTYVNRERSVSK